MQTNTLTTLGIKIPKAIADAETMRTAVMSSTVYADGSDTNTLMAAIRGRSLKPADVLAELGKLGQATAARTALRGHAQDISAALDYADRAALLEAADELYAAMKPIVGEQGAALTAAVSIVGTDPDSRTMASLGSAAGAAWAEFDRSLRVLREVQATVVDIATASGAGRRDLSPLVWQDLATITTMAQYERAKGLHRLQDIAAANVTFALNSPSEVAAIEAKFEQAQAQDRAAEAAAAAAKKAEAARVWSEQMAAGKIPTGR